MSFVRQWLLHNAGLKLLALAISILLWAAYKSEPVVEIGYNVPVAFVNIPRNLEITNEVIAQAHVRLRGRSAFLRRITAADIAVHVDLGHAQAGENNLTLDPGAITVPFGARVVRYSPPQVFVVLTPRNTAPPGS